MEPLDSYPERLNHLPEDLRAEVVLADMLDDGISPDELIINPVGALKRAFGRDISQVRWVEAQHKVQRWLQIDLNRGGLYDLLPEGVFHQPTSNDTQASKEATLREMSVQQQREQAARRFFLPIEQEFFRQRIRIEQEQRTFLSGTNNLLDWFWNLPNFLTPTQLRRLRYMLPVMYRIAGDLDMMTACFEQLVGERVSLQPGPAGVEPVQADWSRLGQWQLGSDSVLDGWLQDEGPLLSITVHIDRSERVAEYLPGQNGLKLIEWLAGYVVPLDADFRIDLDTSALGDGFVFSDEAVFGRLDFTTYV